MSPLSPLPLPEGVKEGYVDCTSSCGLIFHVLHAGESSSSSSGKKALILITHGFPELAYSWRKVMPRLAEAGYFVVAPDQRGYGRTTGWDTRPYDQVDLNQFTMTNLARDLVCLVYALGYEKVHCHIGHDFGAVASALAPLMRPDIFQSCIQASHPHHAPPTPAFALPLSPTPPSEAGGSVSAGVDIQAELAKLSPPRKHYKWYNSTAPAAHDWENPAQGLHAFLRGYFHLKSADWKHNDPRSVKEWSGKALEPLPHYYIMPKDKSMPDTIADDMDGEDAGVTTRWMSDDELAVYVEEWRRTGFQGGLNWYRAQTNASPVQKKDMLLFAGRKIEVPCAFISGAKDWGHHQQPGALDGYEKSCTDFRGATFIPDAGHWVQQEQPEKFTDAVLKFLKSL